MNINTKILLTLLFFATMQAIGQQTWTLDACVAYAVEHNLELHNLKYNAESDRESYRQSIRSLLPNIEGYTSYSIRYGRSIDPNNNDIINTDFFSNDISLRSSVDLFQGFQKINAIRASKLLYKASQEDVLQQKYMLAFRVMSAFYNIRFYKGLVEISKEQAELSFTNYNLVKKKIDLGMLAGADLYEAESVWLADKLVLTQSKNDLEAAQLKLMQEMNLKEHKSITLNTSLNQEEVALRVDSLVLSQDSIYQRAESFIPLIKSEEFKSQAAKKGIAIARGKLYPSLSLFAGYGTGYFETFVDATGSIIPFNTQIKDNASRYVGVSLSIPIFNQWSGRSAIKQKKIQFLRANTNLEIQKQELYKLIQKLVQDLKSMFVESEQSIQKVHAQNLTFKIAQKKFNKGMISALELYQAKNLYAKSQNEDLQLKLKLEVTKSTLNFYKGLPIFKSIRN